MIGQGILAEQAGAPPEGKPRGRPAVRIGFRREAALICLVELDVNRVRLSLVDYGATLIDRIEAPLPPMVFREVAPVLFLSERIGSPLSRNAGAADQLMRIAVSVQGVLDHPGTRLARSPVPLLAGHDIGGGLAGLFGVKVTLWKRGRLLAEGARWLDPDLRTARVASLFVGSTVAMGISGGAATLGEEGGATEFGHLNHTPDGALCRCGMRGCIEAYAADYGVLRTAYSVPEATQPAPSLPPGRVRPADCPCRRRRSRDAPRLQYGRACHRLRSGATVSIFEPSCIVLVGPGARAFGLMQAEIEGAMRLSLIGRIKGTPQVQTMVDEGEPISQGLAQRTLEDLEQSDFAAMPSVAPTATG